MLLRLGRGIFFVAATFLVAPSLASAQPVLLFEGFEENALDPRIATSSVGSFTAVPQVEPRPELGSSKAFGFGLSTCGANCFFGFQSSLAINFGGPRYVSALRFREMELFGNWGSSGRILFGPDEEIKAEFGRFPYNDQTADGTYRIQEIPIDAVVDRLTLTVVDITNQSEIFIDDLTVFGSTATEKASVEWPGNNVSGISILGGWKCPTLGEMTARIDDGAPIPLASNLSRGDTASVCENDGKNGFVAIYNYALAGEGRHIVRFYDGGVEFLAKEFDVNTLGAGFTPYAQGISGSCDVSDFPSTGKITSVTWQQGAQNFQITGVRDK